MAAIKLRGGIRRWIPRPTQTRVLQVKSRILVLLEDDGNSEQVIASLSKRGYDVTHAPTFRDAMSLLEGNNSFDLIISDVHLQNGGNVFDFLRWIKKNPGTSKSPFILFSSKPTTVAKYLEEGIRVSARMLGASMYLTMDKFDAEKFGQQVGALLPVKS